MGSEFLCASFGGPHLCWSGLVASEPQHRIDPNRPTLRGTGRRFDACSPDSCQTVKPSVLIIVESFIKCLARGTRAFASRAPAQDELLREAQVKMCLKGRWS